MRTIALNIALVFMLFLSSCKQGETIPENQITIYAAAGFRPALEELNKIMLDSLQIKLQINYASSGTLARQIEQGGSCDLFISANKQWVEYLADKSLVNDSAVENIAENKLVVIAPKGSDIQIPDFKPCEEMDMLVGDRVAIGNPDFVPVGRYSKMALDSIGWSFLLENNFILCKDVTSVRQYVELGECDWGLVYYTEAVQSKKVEILKNVPTYLHEPIRFYCVKTNGSNTMTTDKLLALIKSDVGSEVLSNLGYKPVRLQGFLLE